MRPRLLDLFCGAGGASLGYSLAGFDVVGVDIQKQKRHPANWTANRPAGMSFVRADALEYLATYGQDFEAIHASPPCQAHTSLTRLWKTRVHPDWLPATRLALWQTGLPFVIENVAGAPLIEPLVLCGTMFALRTNCGAELRRHRLFETNWHVGLVPCCQHYAVRTIGVTGTGAKIGGVRRRAISVHRHTGGSSKRDQREMYSLASARVAMGIDWMTSAELSQAIPPAYSRFLGLRLLQELRG